MTPHASGATRIEWRVGELHFVPPPDLSVQEQLDRYPRNAIPDFRNFSVDILPHLQMAMSFPLLPRSGIRSATWRTTTSIGPSAATGLEVSADTAGGLVAFLATASRGAAAITIFYRLYGER
jgi:hypothetical protein